MFNFRPMIQDDISEVHKIESILFSDPWPKHSFITELKQKNVSHPFVVEEQTKIIGYIICWYYIDELHIGNIAVIPERQRQGIGTFMLNKIFEYFVDYKKAFLEVRESNKNAINLYSEFGFETIYRRKSYYTNGEDALVMIKNRKINH
jgi:ribosomal-protein-alanine N-acetyltransferase